MRLALLLALLMLSSCGVDRQREPPIFSFVSPRDFDTTAACLVAGLNDEMRPTINVGNPPITHKIDIITPGRVYEILPQRPLMESGDVYVMRLTRYPDGKIGVDVYSMLTGGWPDRMEHAVTKCR